MFVEMIYVLFLEILNLESSIELETTLSPYLIETFWRERKLKKKKGKKKAIEPQREVLILDRSDPFST